MNDGTKSGAAPGALLNQVLHLLGEGGIHSTAELARRLGVSEGLVTAMAADLMRHGYLAPIALDCGTTCSGCWAPRSRGVETSAVARGLGTAESCGRSETAIPTLTLTPKGRQASARMR
jgi:hypothetical protein